MLSDAIPSTWALAFLALVYENACVQTTAMYYMCYYTMMREPILDKISRCHVRDQKASNNWAQTHDFRNHNRYAFECAIHLFCPGQYNF